MAAFTTAPANWTNSSDANFRAWGLAVATKLGQVGLVQTADAGQINWTTVTAPGGADTYQGYEIWRFADALQATAPVFMKVQYGSGASNAANPGIRVVFGSGSDGAGNLTGVLSSNLDSEATASAGAVTAYWSGSTNRFAMAIMSSAVANQHLMLFERSLDSLGAVTSEAVLWLSKPSLSATVMSELAWDTATGDKTAVETTFGVLVPANGTGVTGTQIAVYPVFHQKGVFMFPGMNSMVYFNAAITANSQIAVPVYGASRVYMPLGSTVGITAGAFRGAVTGTALMVRYE
jgi:hypothetical protein